MNWKLLLAGALVAATTPALAADLAPVPVEPVAPIVLPLDWSGLYIGAQVGYAWNSADTEFPGGGGPVLNPDADGVVGGIYVGYNAQFGQFVVGVEADAEASGASGDAGDDFFNSNSDLDENWQGSVRARLGYAINNFMPYITGGVAFSDWDVDAGTFLPPRVTDSYSETFTGWTIGGGLEVAVTPNVIARIEYRYTDFGNETTDIDLAPFEHEVDLTNSTVRVGIAYKF
jgi:outer membrane immunogenic protein